MIILKFKRSVMLAVGAVLVGVVGCGQGVSQRDVSDAKNAVQEEQEETAEVREEAEAAVEEERRETAQVRQEVMKPVIDEDAAEAVREEQAETDEAIEEASAAIEEEKRETDQAQQELGELDVKREAQQEREAFADKVQATLDESEQLIAKLRDQVDEADQADADSLQDQIGELVLRRERLEESLLNLESADLLKWGKHRDDVQRDIKDLENEIREAK